MLRYIIHLFKTFTLWDLLVGLSVTLRAMFRHKVTIQFPEQRTPISPRFRGKHALRRYPNGEERCIACKLCEAVCPANAITIESEEDANGIRRAKVYDIDMFKCIYCGFCEEACPVDAVVETDVFDYHFEDSSDKIMDKEMLLKMGDKHEESIAKSRTIDAQYR